MKSPVLVLLGTLLAYGCGTSTTFTPLNPPPRTLTVRTPASVAVFSSSKPGRPYVDVGLIEVTHVGGSDTPLLIQKIRERGGELGCDAVVIGGISDRGGSDAPFDTGGRTVHATCAVYKL